MQIHVERGKVQSTLGERNQRPDYGHIIQHYRVVMGWTAEQLGELYGNAVRGQPYTERWVQIMENDNRVPIDLERRKILAALLNIPLAYLLPETAHSLLPAQSVPKTDREGIDATEFRTALLLFSIEDGNGVTDTMSTLKAIGGRILKLERACLYSNQKEQLFPLLCGYHIRAASIAISPHRIRSAMDHVNKAIMLAKERKYYALHIAALNKRGSLLFDQEKFHEARTNFEAARGVVEELKERGTLNKYISPKVQQNVGLAVGQVLAHTATERSEVDCALRAINEAECFTGQAGSIENDLFSLYNFAHNLADPHQISLVRGSALIGSPLQCLHRPKDAQEQLEKANITTEAGPYTASPKRQGYNYILQARAYYDLGYYEMATALATEAMTMMKEIHSWYNMERIRGLYSDLSTSPYGKSTDVAWLRLELVRAGGWYQLTINADPFA